MSNNSFATRLKNRFGNKAYAAILSTLQNLQVPIPDADEFLDARDGILIPIGSHASVIRIHFAKKYPLIKSEHLLTPIAAIQIDQKVRLDIQPTGEYLPDLQDDVFTRLEGQMAKLVENREGIIMGDTFPLNWITIDKKMAGKKSGYQMLNFDPHEITLNEPSQHETPELMKNSAKFWDTKKVAKNTVQGTYFSEHRAAFAKAHDPKTDTLNAQGITDFWHLMASSKKAGKLTVEWNWKREGEEFGAKHISDINRNYSKRMEKEAPELFLPS